MQKPLEISVVMPCLNEGETLELCIRKAFDAIVESGMSGEVVIADNGSADNSPAIAIRNHARLIHVPQRGYGSALMKGIHCARGQYIIMGDSDGSYDFAELELFVGKLSDGYDLVIGNRFKGGIERGAMPFLHQYLGNPFFTYVGRLFFKTPIGDLLCGIRGFTKDAFTRMNLQSKGMEFAAEMVVKASLLGMKVTEVPTILSPDGRARKPHLKTWRDGWKILRFFLTYQC